MEIVMDNQRQLTFGKNSFKHKFEMRIGNSPYRAESFKHWFMYNETKVINLKWFISTFVWVRLLCCSSMYTERACFPIFRCCRLGWSEEWEWEESAGGNDQQLWADALSTAQSMFVCLINITVDDTCISVISLISHKCPGSLKNVDLSLGSLARHLLGLCCIHGQAQTWEHPFFTPFERLDIMQLFSNL